MSPALCAHYGMAASRNNPGRGHENGSIESPHRHLKRRLAQRLSMRGSTSFASIAEYQRFIDSVTASINRRNAQHIAAEHAMLAPLPCRRAVDYTEAMVRVTTSSTITVRKALYSVPARLIGERLRVHLYDDRLVLHHGGRELLTLTRVRPGRPGQRARCIDYRHVIGWLARKPRALAGLAFRDELLPGADWRAIYQHLGDTLGTADACRRVVAALKLAAEHDDAQRLGAFWLDALQRDQRPTLAALQAHAAGVTGRTMAVPVIQTTQHRLADYDALLAAPTATPEVVCHD